MNWGFIGLLVVFALFIILLIANPKLSCFGRRITSPLYPLFRRRKMKRRGTAGPPAGGAEGIAPEKPVEDYGLKLD
ncbi:MAG: hypothetical protein A2Y56_13145 [Candidatus Aminicenantes bacterium RBG_13_63_10]|nr:MAG: hypothetical protein A2Y56_13145 [Candidatus Aminicenantes bacterium RBG_13_63_10]